MSADFFKDVGEFHLKFGLPVEGDDVPHPLEPELLNFRFDFLLEELREFGHAAASDDLPEMADALVDLIYVACGTAHLMGLPLNELWDDVHQANMTKQRAATDGSDSKRGSSFDVIKPEGWVGPDGAAIIERHMKES